ncbi:MAG: molybdopterin-dependent oxidoreductase [Planctomycetaceae bacterium]|nr:molybdopterin-dependent oxidoreductase [Planctomycetaceae bacterium]
MSGLYSPQNDPKYQKGEVPDAAAAPPDAVISEDTRRKNRIPEGQHRTRKWPVLHAATVPEIDARAWKLSIGGLVREPLAFTLAEFSALPRTRVFADFHCVTAWSRLGNLWEGVSMKLLLEMAGVSPDAHYAVVSAWDVVDRNQNPWTTNLPLSDLAEQDVLLADTHDGLPLDADHGGPVRLVVPKLFAWKSAKWVRSIEITKENHPGYWEQAGYHNVGDPWKNERYRDDPEWLAQQ